jgi:transposase
VSKRRRQYTEEFRRDAVRLAAKLGNLSAAARDLGVSSKQLREWREVYAGQGVVAPGSIAPDLEMKQLRRENATLREERDILKKALAIFSDRPR